MTGGTGISINDPFFGREEDITNQRLRLSGLPPNQQSLETQRLIQLLQNQPTGGGVGGLYGDVIANPDPSVTPFPIGCPSGFFQEGNVCVPIIGTYPDETFNAPPAGLDFAKGVIDHIEGPNLTRAGADAEMRIFMRNMGAIRGKFQARVVIESWNIDTLSISGWVPQYTPAIINIKFKVPSTAVLGTGTIPGQIELQGLDEVTREFKIHDVASYNFPQPQETGTGPVEPECFTWNNVQYCETTTPTGANCIELNNKFYCPPVANCFTYNNIQYCESTTPTENCITIGGKHYCPVVTEPDCFTFNNIEYCESDEITSPNCVQIGERIFCPTTPCPTGQHKEGNVCVPDTCPTGQEMFQGHCVPVCPTGYERTTNGSCIPKVCPTGQEFDPATGTCKPKVCPSGYELIGNQCLPKICPIGQRLNPATGNCEQITCPPGYHLVGSVCYPNPIPPPPPESHAMIMAPTRVPDGNSFEVKGYGFRPYETVEIRLYLVWQSGRGHYNGRTYTQTRQETASSHGSFTEHMRTEEVPSGVSGVASITATGLRSGKVATRTVDIT